MTGKLLRFPMPTRPARERAARQLALPFAAGPAPGAARAFFASRELWDRPALSFAGKWGEFVAELVRLGYVVRGERPTRASRRDRRAA